MFVFLNMFVFLKVDELWEPEKVVFQTKNCSEVNQNGYYFKIFACGGLFSIEIQIYESTQINRIFSVNITFPILLRYSGVVATYSSYSTSYRASGPFCTNIFRGLPR